VVLFLVLFTASFSYLHRVYGRKFFDATGRAEWIWARHRINTNVPVVFFAAHDFNLPPHRPYTRVKILGDPEYTLYLNGVLVGGRRIGQNAHLDLYDVSALARNGRNRIVVAVRSVSGVGGLIASIDNGLDHNAVVTGPDWAIYRHWSPRLLAGDLSSVAGRPQIIGKPPIGQWDYLPIQTVAGQPAVTGVLQPKGEESRILELPLIRVQSGVAVAGTVKEQAVIYDFGHVAGRVRLRLIGTPDGSAVVHVRLANVPEDIDVVETQTQPYVFGSGEETLTDPEQNRFRYVIVYGGKARAEVVQ
jgi:hypothetical protein